MHWPVKIAAKLALSRLPFDYRVWRKIGFFRLGEMENTAYALKIFRLHEQECWPEGLPPDFTALELGCGDSVASALIAAGRGARKIWLIDTGPYASRNVVLYKKMAQELKAGGVPAPDISQAGSLEDIMNICRAEYVTRGLESLRALPSDSVDFVWSHSVLEHVRKREFLKTMKELRRVLKKTGRASHNVNLQDHLCYALNNLRFSEALWESECFAGAGFYTNRLRYRQMLDLMCQAGFSVLSEDSGRWDKIPTPRERMAAPFRNLPEDELLIRTCHIVLTPGKD
jgi:SAM-dependent methyltransferase